MITRNKRRSKRPKRDALDKTEIKLVDSFGILRARNEETHGKKIEKMKINQKNSINWRKYRPAYDMMAVKSDFHEGR